MSSRRTFLKQSFLSGTLLLPGALTEALRKITATRKETAVRPLILSTWNHGYAANQMAWKTLRETGSILDAVEQGVRVTEADPNTLSVGLEAHPDREGIVTLDASIMKGSGDCGSVCFVRRIKHPITLARMVMEETPHIMLAGEGAQQFAVEQGLSLEEEILHPRAKEKYEEWKKTSEYRPEINFENHDTIGMIGMDRNGVLAGSCTTSGLKYKMHGRVGDSPIIGAGLYVDNEVGAATATGKGEAIIKICGSFLIVELMRQGRTPQEACEEAIRRLLSKPAISDEDLQVGFLAINKNGEYGSHSVVPGFTYAVRHEHENKVFESSSRFTDSN